MSNGRPSSNDLLDAAIKGFQDMNVTDRPKDEEVLNRLLGSSHCDGTQPATHLPPTKQKFPPRLLATLSGVTAVAIVLASLALSMRKKEPSDLIVEQSPQPEPQKATDPERSAVAFSPIANVDSWSVLQSESGSILFRVRLQP
jgi:hypothetical protein